MRPYRKYNWPELITSFEASGLSQKAFCAQHQINPRYFSQKRSAFLRQSQSAFAKVEVANLAKPERSISTFTIQVGRCQVQCPNDMAISAFADLVHQLA